MKNTTWKDLKTQIEAIKKDAFGIHELDILLTCVTIQVEGMKILVVFIPIWNIIYNLTKSYERAIPIRSRDSSFRC